MTYCMNPFTSCFFSIHHGSFVHSLSILPFLLFQWNLGMKDKSAHVFLSMAFLKERFKHLLDILSLPTCRTKNLVLPLVSDGGR